LVLGFGILVPRPEFEELDPKPNYFFEFPIHLCVEPELEQNKTRTGELT
jgi:hypothetical protein